MLMNFKYPTEQKNQLFDGNIEGIPWNYGIAWECRGTMMKTDSMDCLRKN